MKALLVATMQSHICQFHKWNVEVLHELGFKVDVAAHDNLAVKNGLRLDFADRVLNVPFERSPFSIKNFQAYKELKQIIKAGNYDYIIGNTPVGGLLTRLSARKARREGVKVIYIAHGFHFYKGASWLNWLLYYPIEKLLSRLTDIIVTINSEDFKQAINFKANRVIEIHGLGVSPKRFFPLSPEEIQKEKEVMGYGGRKILLCTGELNRNKNQSCLLSALPSIIKSYPDVLLLIAGNGPLKDGLVTIVANHGLTDYVKFLDYRTDLERYIRIADVAVSCSRREGLPLNIVEAMMCKIPVVVSNNRGHRELVKEGENGYLVDSRSPEAFAHRIMKLFFSKELRKQMGERGYEIAQQFNASNVKEELRQLYL